MATVLELAADIVAAHASSTSMDKEDILTEIKEIYATLSALEKGEVLGESAGQVQEENAPVVSMRKAFGKNQVFCMICGKGFTTLKRHLSAAHDMSAKEYRSQFGIPAGTVLAAKAYSESRKQMAIDKGLAEGLAKARAAKNKMKKSKP